MIDDCLLYDLDAERAALASVLLPPSKYSPPAFDDVAEIITARCFYSESHQLVFEATAELQKNGTAIDAVTVAAELANRGQLERIGGPPYIGQILETVPHAAHARYYAEIVLEKFHRRELNRIAFEMKEAIKDPGRETETIVTETEQRLHGLMESATDSESPTIADVLAEMAECPEVGTPLPTGFSLLDDLLDGGFLGGKLFILAARPSMGKSALAGNIAINAARAGNPCQIFSMEQKRFEVAGRFLASLSGVDASLLKAKNQHRQTADDKARLCEAQNRLSKLPIRVKDRAGLRIGQIATEARLRKRRDDLGLIIVDYLQLIEPDDRRIPREQQVATISRQLKLLAMDLDCPVLCLAQLNRAVEARENKRPRLSDLRESGAIEQDADVVMFLDRPPVYDKDAEQKDPTEAYAIVEKNRDGRRGDAKLHWDGPTVSFRNPAPPRFEDGWPTT